MCVCACVRVCVCACVRVCVCACVHYIFDCENNKNIEHYAMCSQICLFLAFRIQPEHDRAQFEQEVSIPFM